MTKEALLKGIPKLPTIEIGTVAKNHQIIEGNHGNVHYKATKERTLGGLTLFSLSISGPNKEKRAFIQEVAAELGPPLVVMEFPEFAELRGIHFALWDAKGVDKRLKKSQR